MAIAIAMIYLFGIGNFAMHKAVLESDHPLLGQMPWFYHLLGGRFSLLVEFLMLLGAMLLAADGSTGWAWGYGIYSLFNTVTAWLIVSGRV